VILSSGIGMTAPALASQHLTAAWRRAKIMTAGETCRAEDSHVNPMSEDRNELLWPQLMAAAQQGDKAAYRRLLTEITPFIRAIARRRLANASDAEDAVQDVLLTVHQIRASYDPSRPFAPWLTVIATRRVMDRLRMLYRHRGSEEPLEDGHADLADGAAMSGEDAMRRRDIDRALAALPPAHRRAVELINLEGRSLAEASAITGQTVGALKVTIHRAMKLLRRLSGEPHDQ